MEKSSPTMMFRLFTRSARTPPAMERITIGAKEQAVTTPNRAGDPVLAQKIQGQGKAQDRVAEEGDDLSDHDEKKIPPKRCFLHIYLHDPMNKPTVGL